MWIENYSLDTGLMFTLGFIITSAARRGKIHEEATKARHRRQSIFNYIETGKKSKTFYSNARRTIAAAERARQLRVDTERRKIENENIEFKAVQQCPKCRRFDTHWLKAREDGTLMARVCLYCKYEWHTVG